MTARKRTSHKAKKQAQLPFPNRGGKRPGAGRKPNGDRAGVSHLKRNRVHRDYPVHITIKLRRGLPSLRMREARTVLHDCLRASMERHGLRIVEFSIQRDHIHLLCECRGRPCISRGMQGLCVRIARRLNRLWGRKGTVFADRYHDVVLRSPTQVKRALCYVLHNFKKHRRGSARPRPKPRTAQARAAELIDAYSSAPWFTSWKETVEVRGLEAHPRPAATASSWLLSVGWRRARGGSGGISVYEEPG